MNTFNAQHFLLSCAVCVAALDYHRLSLGLCCVLCAMAVLPVVLATCRNVGLVAEMLMSLQRLAPPASSSGAACAALSPVEAQQLAAGIQAMSDVLLDRLDK
jgi:hypothetical protein